MLRTTGLTYAEYARQGFGQLVVVTLLTTVVLALIRWFASEQTAADRSIKRGVVLTMTALSLLVVGSALHRLWLYQDAYGFTTARITAAPRGGLAGPRRHPRRGGRGRLVVGVGRAGGSFSASALAVALPLVNLDARVVELNAARYEATGKVDVDYLAVGPGRLGRDRRELPTRDGCLRPDGYLDVDGRQLDPRGTWAGSGWPVPRPRWGRRRESAPRHTADRRRQEVCPAT